MVAPHWLWSCGLVIACFGTVFIRTDADICLCLYLSCHLRSLIGLLVIDTANNLRPYPGEWTKLERPRIGSLEKVRFRMQYRHNYVFIVCLNSLTSWKMVVISIFMFQRKIAIKICWWIFYDWPARSLTLAQSWK